MSRLSAVFSTLVIGFLLRYGVLAVFIFIATAMLGVAVVVGVWGPNTNAATLEKLSS
jgi:putative MFS transporter